MVDIGTDKTRKWKLGKLSASAVRMAMSVACLLFAFKVASDSACYLTLRSPIKLQTST